MIDTLASSFLRHTLHDNFYEKMFIFGIYLLKLGPTRRRAVAAAKLTSQHGKGRTGISKWGQPEHRVGWSCRLIIVVRCC